MRAPVPLVAMTVLAALARGQDPGELRPVFPAGVELVTVDVVVVDREGAPVRGLRGEDFTLGSEGVLVRMRQGGRGKESGVDVEMPPLWQLYRLRAGRVVRVEIYRDEQRAREALGLPE